MYQKPAQDALRQFIDQHAWQQQYPPENLAMSISIEAGELLECFQWGNHDFAGARAELADVLIHCMILAHRLGVDPFKLVAERLRSTVQDPPADKPRGPGRRVPTQQLGGQHPLSQNCS